MNLNEILANWQNWLRPPIQQPTGLVNDPVVQGRLNNERSAGSVLGAEDTLRYATSLPRTTPTPTPAPAAPTGGGGGGNPAPQNNNNNPGVPDTFGQMIALARAAADEGRRRAGEQFNRARGIYDEGVGALNKRRQDFQKLFDTGRETILDRYEGERGNLQASDQGARTRMSNALRALGLGGSAFIKSEGRQTQDAAKALGGLQTQRNTNETANQNEFNTRQEWARGQESELNRYLQDAEENRRAAENQTALVERGDVNTINSNINSYLQNMYNTQAALATSGANIGGYQANPYAVNMSSLVSALNGSIPQVGQMGAGGVQNVNLQEQNPTLSLIDPRKRAGVQGAGLYA